MRKFPLKKNIGKSVSQVGVMEILMYGESGFFTLTSMLLARPKFRQIWALGLFGRIGKRRTYSFCVFPSKKVHVKTIDRGVIKREPPSPDMACCGFHSRPQPTRDDRGIGMEGASVVRRLVVRTWFRAALENPGWSLRPQKKQRMWQATALI